MENQQHDICRADLAAFLTEMGINMKKEGASLQALAKQWFEGSCEFEVLRAYSISIDSLGDQILAVKKHLCQKCLMKKVVTGISIANHSDTEKEDGETKKSNPGKEKKI